jgi:hypothetical protein
MQHFGLSQTGPEHPTVVGGKYVPSRSIASSVVGRTFSSGPRRLLGLFFFADCLRLILVFFAFRLLTMWSPRRLLGDDRLARMDEGSRRVQWPATTKTTQYHAVDIRPATCLGNALGRVFSFSYRPGDRFSAPQPLRSSRRWSGGRRCSPSWRPLCRDLRVWVRSLFAEADAFPGEGEPAPAHLS